MTTIGDIEPGDVLLFRGRGLIPWAIRLFDGGEVNHAAIALDAADVAEAAGAGLQRAALAGAATSNIFTEIRRREGADVAPVLARANAFVDEGAKYAYHQIVLLALLAVTRRIPVPWAARRLIRSALDHAATAVGDLVPTGRSRMICSEFVYRCYAEATPPSPITIELATVFASGAPEGDTVLDWALRQDDRDVALPLAVTFAGGFDAAVAEADLERHIREYAEAAGLAGTLPDDLAPSVTFGAPPEPLPVPTDDEVLASLAVFGTALHDAALPSTISPTFGGTGAIASVALKGALKGILDVSIDANFVTPRDLSKTLSLRTVGRVTP